MTEESQNTLASIELMLVRNFTSPGDALRAAYRLGRLEGMLEVARLGENRVLDLLKAAA